MKDGGDKMMEINLTSGLFAFLCGSIFVLGSILALSVLARKGKKNDFTSEFGI